jgi:hypothetical protein
VLDVRAGLLQVAHGRAHGCDTLRDHRVLRPPSDFKINNMSGGAGPTLSLSARSRSPSVSSCVEMSIVPWWYARALTILYAEPETCLPLVSLFVPPHGLKRTHLVLPHTDVVPLVEPRARDAQREHGPQDKLRGRAAIKGASREVDGEVSVAEVLRNTSK